MPLTVPGYIELGDGYRAALGRVGTASGRDWVDGLDCWRGELERGDVAFVAFLVDEALFGEFPELVLSSVLRAMDPGDRSGFRVSVGRLRAGGDPPPLAVLVERRGSGPEPARAS